MSSNHLILLFCSVSLLAYLIAYIKKRPTALLSFLGRCAAGLLFIYYFNIFCDARSIITNVGINPLTTGISAFLGIPGVLLAYAIDLTRFL